MKTSLLTVLSFFIISCTQATSNSQSGTEWPTISDVQISSSASFVSISWLANAEPKNVYYEVVCSTDGVTYKTVGLVLAGFAGEQHFSYLFREKKKEAVIAVYRIKQVKQDGSFRIVAERSV